MVDGKIRNKTEMIWREWQGQALGRRKQLFLPGRTGRQIGRASCREKVYVLV